MRGFYWTTTCCSTVLASSVIVSLAVIVIAICSSHTCNAFNPKRNQDESMSARDRSNCFPASKLRKFWPREHFSTKKPPYYLDDLDYGPLNPEDLIIEYDNDRFSKGDTVPENMIERAAVPCSNSSAASCKFRQVCGRAPLNPLTSGNKMAPYMLNAVPQVYGDWPAYVRVVRWELSIRGERVISWCGGTLLTDRHVLTAGHCAYASPESDGILQPVKQIDIHLADKEIWHDKDQFEQIKTVKRVCLSKGYKLYPDGTASDDWALMELNEPVKFNDHVQPACLPFEPITRTGKMSKCYMMGAGNIRTKHGQILFSSLINVMAVEQITCKAFDLNDRDRSRECYAKAKRNQGSACSGDSGSPVLCLDKMNRWTIVGVVSYGDDAPSAKCSGNGPKAWKTVVTRMRTLLSDVKQQCNF